MDRRTPLRVAATTRACKRGSDAGKGQRRHAAGGGEADIHGPEEIEARLPATLRSGLAAALDRGVATLRGRRLVVAAAVAVLAMPASASAAARFASPTGNGTACTEAAPCDVVTAVTTLKAAMT
jgi:hypothetical protein